MKSKDSPSQNKLEVSALSETGYVRDENQDYMRAYRLPLGQLYIVADGMGGHKGGAAAAKLTVEGLYEHLSKAPAGTPVDQIIKTAFEKANKAVYQEANSGHPETEGMGSTAVMVLIKDSIAQVAHVGDSRAYRYHKGKLHRLTTDHTVVQKMVDAKMITPEQAVDHPNAGVLDRGMGIAPDVEVEIGGGVSLADGDGILLCSDGLCGYVDDAAIESVLHSDATVQDIPKELVKLALETGGEDNITVQFVQYGRRRKYLVKKSKHRLLSTAMTFILGVVLAGAVGFYLKYREQIWPNVELTIVIFNKSADTELRGSLIDVLAKRRLVKFERRTPQDWENAEILALNTSMIYYTEKEDSALKTIINKLQEHMSLDAKIYGDEGKEKELREMMEKEFGFNHILIVVSGSEGGTQGGQSATEVRGPTNQTESGVGEEQPENDTTPSEAGGEEQAVVSGNGSPPNVEDSVPRGESPVENDTSGDGSKPQQPATSVNGGGATGGTQ